MAVKLNVKKHSTAAKYSFGTKKFSSTMLMSVGENRSRDQTVVRTAGVWAQNELVAGLMGQK